MSVEDTIDKKPKLPTDTAEAVAKAIEAPEVPAPADAGETFEHKPAGVDIEDSHDEQLAAVRTRLAEAAQGRPELSGTAGEGESATGEVGGGAGVLAGHHDPEFKEEIVKSMEEFIVSEDDRLSERAIMSGVGTFVIGSTGTMVGATILGFSVPVSLVAMPVAAGLVGLGVWRYMKRSGKREVQRMRDDAAEIAKNY